MKVTTKSGFEWDIDPDNFNDWEMLEAFYDMDRDPRATVAVARTILGQEGLNALKEHLRTEKGKVPMDRMMDELTELLNNANPN